MIERAKLHGIDDKRWAATTRTRGIPSTVSHSAFQSAAYGSAETTRVKMPGRLNHDLMIHFKRGVRRFDSYSLNNVSIELTKQEIHDVPVKELFRVYREGDNEGLCKSAF